MNRIISIALLLFFFTACKKSELTSYEQPDMVYVYRAPSGTNNDSASYSFAIKGTITMDTVKIPLRIMGVARNTDREVQVNVIKDSTTAVAGKHYDILPTIVKAGEYTTNINVLVKRAADLKTSEVRLLVEIGESKDFKPGVPNTASVSPRAGGALRYLVKINDYLSKPANWDTRLTTFFGTYSQVKYLFVISVTGKSDFAYGTATGPSYNEMAYYNLLVKTELNNYVAAHGPLIDEFGATVTFP